MTGQGTQILLIVSSDKTEHERLGSILMPMWNCVFASSVKEALVLVRSRLVPSLIMLDADIKGGGAFDFYSRLRSKIQFEDIPVIFMLDKDAAKEVKCLSLGAADVVHRTCSGDVLLGRIDRILSNQYMNDYLVSKICSYSDSLKEEHEKLVRYTRQVVSSLSKAIDAKDQYTKGHSFRVAEYSRMIAERLGLDDQMCEIIYQSGLLHDIGKIGVSDTVLRKPGELNEMEVAAIRNHPMIGYQILSSISEIPLISEGARYHHERFDGKGYPEGLKGKKIPLIARIICVADSYDAMTSNRSYRKPLSPLKAKDEILRCAGTQFDPVIAGVAAELIEKMVNDGFIDDRGISFGSVYICEEESCAV